ncbi:hypothetical protein DEO72_LG1g2647 [Vigna unguiculata]|uniref:Uncharacterized protein n=1 Tax=Vigna unguiculata TaxID=3917 RepID=A0A4D6KQS1_VIGUN|nr:hypothetical protein DEO72_LG1g2647 [Vigna unguiculata]
MPRFRITEAVSLRRVKKPQFLHCAATSSPISLRASPSPASLHHLRPRSSLSDLFNRDDLRKSRSRKHASDGHGHDDAIRVAEGEGEGQRGHHFDSL